MMNEFWRAFGPDAAITIRPGPHHAALEVFLNGELIYDRDTEAAAGLGKFPDWIRIKQLKQLISDKFGYEGVYPTSPENLY